MIGVNLKIKQSSSELPAESVLVDMTEIGYFEPGVKHLVARGIGPCFVFVAFYEQRPLAIYYWGGPSSDNEVPIAQLISLALDGFRFKITEKSEALALPDFEDEYPDGDEPIDILPIGGQTGSQAIVDAILKMSEEGENRILSVDYLKRTTNMDYLDLFVDANEVGLGAIGLEHIISEEHYLSSDDEGDDECENESFEVRLSVTPTVYVPHFDALSTSNASPLPEASVAHSSPTTTLLKKGAAPDSRKRR